MTSDMVFFTGQYMDKLSPSPVSTLPRVTSFLWPTSTAAFTTHNYADFWPTSIAKKAASLHGFSLRPVARPWRGFWPTHLHCRARGRVSPETGILYVHHACPIWLLLLQERALSNWCHLCRSGICFNQTGTENSSGKSAYTDLPQPLARSISYDRSFIVLWPVL